MPYESALVFGFTTLAIAAAWTTYKSLKALLGAATVLQALKDFIPYLAALIILMELIHFIMLSIEIATI